MRHGVSVARLMLAIALLSSSTGCNGSRSAPPPRTVQIQQNWQLQPGSNIAGHEVISGLGDISIDVNGGRIYAPFDGQVEPDQADCAIFSSPHVPAYLIRLCGLQSVQWGAVEEGKPIGRSQSLQVAVLRKQPDGRWAMVEPSNTILERTLR